MVHQRPGESPILDALLREGDEFTIVASPLLEVIQCGAGWSAAFDDVPFLETLDAESLTLAGSTLAANAPLSRSIQLSHTDRLGGIYRIAWRRICLPDGTRLLLGHDAEGDDGRIEEIARLQNDFRLSTAELSRLANTDALTGLQNRRAILGAARALWAVSRKATTVILDLDNFKRYNDLYGHEAGDAVLCESARALADTVGTTGVVGRWGGEEFACILEGDASACCGELLEALRRVRLNDGQVRLTVTGSAGAAVVSDTSRVALEDAIAAADAAMYAAKHAGRDRFVIRHLSPRSTREGHPARGERRVSRRWALESP